MKTKEFNFTIKFGNGKYNNLDKNYNDYITKMLIDSDENIKTRLEVLSIIMDELIEIKEIDCFEEAKYRLTDGENTLSVMSDMIERNKHKSNLLWFLKKRIDEFIDEDFHNKFF
jgi:hypothetical protein